MEKETLVRRRRCDLFVFPALLVACGSGSSTVAPPDSGPPDGGGPPDSLPLDSFPPDSLQPDSFPPEACKSGAVTADCTCGPHLGALRFLLRRHPSSERLRHESRSVRQWSRDRCLHLWHRPSQLRLLLRGTPPIQRLRDPHAPKVGGMRFRCHWYQRSRIAHSQRPHLLCEGSQAL